MTEMRVLTVRQPWAAAIIYGAKDIENRVRKVAGKYRGPIAIHAAATYDDSTYRAATGTPISDFMDWSSAWPSKANILGAIIGVVDLVDEHPAQSIDVTTYDDRTDRLQATCCKSRWAEPEGHHLVLANPRYLISPHQLKGGLGLRRLDDGTRKAIEGDLMLIDDDREYDA